MHKQLALVFGVLVALLAGNLVVLNTKASGTSSWLNSSLVFQKEADTQSLPSTLNGNIDCALENSTCSVPTRYGAGTSNSTVRLNTTGQFYPVYSFIENRQRFLPIPNSSTAITYTTEPPYGLYLYFNYNFSSSIKKVFVFGEAYQMTRPPDGKLVDKSNKRLAADYNSMSFSQNGRWMVVSQPNVAVLRVNLETFEVVPFGQGFNYTIGLDPAPKTAITNDGRYAVVASKVFDRFILYDLSTCGPVPDSFNGPVFCQSRDLGSFMKQQIPGYQFIAQARFLNNDLLAVYANYKESAVSKTARLLISNTNITSQIDYLALGDSYISGEGAFDYQSGTDTKNNQCHLSLRSYPYLIGHDLNYNSYHSIACSGATTDDITNSSQEYKGQVNNRKGPPRSERSLNDIDSIFASFAPGYINQSDFASRYRPRIINLSIGGNDIGFSDIVQKCALPWNIDNCYESYEDRLELVRLINSKFPILVNTYTTIKNQLPPDSRIYIIGYPQIAKTGGDCALNVRLSDEEVRFSELVIEYLDMVINAAADRAGVYYVDTQDALNGHRLCEAESGFVAMNGLTGGTDLPRVFDGKLAGPIANESYHPNELGHQLLKNKILAVTNNLTNPMPAPNPGAGLPPEAGLEILNAPRQNRPVYATQYNDNMSDDILFQGASAELDVQGLDYSLIPEGNYRAELHSEVVSLGSFSTDSNGNVNSQIQVPYNAPIGFHTLHLFGTNLAGENIDIYKNVYVAASEDDYDGDGIDNNADPCFFIEPSGQDYDQDGVDDACDGIITQSPPPSPNPPSEQGSDDTTSSDPTEEQASYSPVVLSSNTNGGTRPPVANSEAAPTLDLFNPANNYEVVTPKAQSVTTPSTPVSTEQDGSKFDFSFNPLKQQWDLIIAISITTAASLGLLWKKSLSA